MGLTDSLIYTTDTAYAMSNRKDTTGSDVTLALLPDSLGEQAKMAQTQESLDRVKDQPDGPSKDAFLQLAGNDARRSELAADRSMALLSNEDPIGTAPGNPAGQELAGMIHNGGPDALASLSYKTDLVVDQSSMDIEQSMATTSRPQDNYTHRLLIGSVERLTTQADPLQGSTRQPPPMNPSLSFLQGAQASPSEVGVLVRSEAERNSDTRARQLLAKHVLLLRKASGGTVRGVLDKLETALTHRKPGATTTIMGLFADGLLQAKRREDSTVPEDFKSDVAEMRSSMKADMNLRSRSVLSDMIRESNISG